LHAIEKIALHDEKFICKLRRTLLKRKCPVRAGHFHLKDDVKDRDNSGA
jgi:hypothetical protein